MNGRIFYGWYIVGICFLSLLFVSGVGLLSYPVFVRPIETEFAWSRTAIMAGVAIAATAAGICLPLIGHLIDKIGARRVMLGGIFLAGCSFLLISTVKSLFMWYLSLTMAGIGIASSTFIPVASLVTNWFVQRRGLAMSIAMAGTGAGGFIMPNVASWVVQARGWRLAYAAFGLSTLGFLLPLAALVVRVSPADIGLKPFGGFSHDEPVAPEDGVSMHLPHIANSAARAALGKRNFWNIGIADFCNAFGVIGLGVHLVAYAVEAGVGASTAALAYSAINAATLGGIVVVGAAADRLNHRWMITLSYVAPAVGVLFLFNLQTAFPLFLFAAVAGLSAAGRVTLWPLVVSDTFGRKAYATVMGFLVIFYAVGMAIAPPITGLLYDITGGYTWILIVSIAAFGISGIQIAAGAANRRSDHPAANERPS